MNFKKKKNYEIMLKESQDEFNIDFPDIDSIIKYSGWIREFISEIKNTNVRITVNIENGHRVFDNVRIYIGSCEGSLEHGSYNSFLRRQIRFALPKEWWCHPNCLNCERNIERVGKIIFDFLKEELGNDREIVLVNYFAQQREIGDF